MCKPSVSKKKKKKKKKKKREEGLLQQYSGWGWPALCGVAAVEAYNTVWTWTV